MMYAMARYQYATVAKSTTDLMDPLLRRMQELLTMQRTRPGDNSMNQELEVVEEKLAWLVYFVSAMLGGQSIGYYSYTSAKPGGHELTDADLSRRVLQLLNAIDMRISSTVKGGRGTRAQPGASHVCVCVCVCVCGSMIDTVAVLCFTEWSCKVLAASGDGAGVLHFEL